MTMTMERAPRPARIRRRKPITDPIRQKILDAIERQDRERLEGLSLPDVSRYLGMGDAYMWQYLYLGTPAELSEGPRARLSLLLDIPEAELIPPSPFEAAIREVRSRSGETPDGETVRKSPLRPPLETPLPMPMRAPTLHTVPVYRARTAGVRTLGGRVPRDTDETVRVPSFVSDRVKCAVRVTDAALAPRYKVGDLLLCDPEDPPGIGDGIVAAMKSGELVLGIIDDLDLDGGTVRLRASAETADDSKMEYLALEHIENVMKEAWVKRC